MKKEATGKKNSRGSRKSASRLVPSGRLYISATFNSTLVSVTDQEGNVLCWSSTGESGFSGSRKSTPFAATIAIENALTKAKAFGLSEVDLYIKGIGPGRDVVLTVLRSTQLKVKMIVDQTPVPHNGTRSRKAKHNR